MCGVAGFINLNGEPAQVEVLKQMTSSIKHRGPDGEGFWVKENIGIGHRRLSIIDLSIESRQPMQSADGRFILSYNGEIYNFKTLKAELQSHGYIFRSSGDTEVVLYSLIEWGTEAFRRFNGMFALAFYDQETRDLLIARDRYGVKPLYYSQTENLIAFASEQKAIMALPGFKRIIDKAAVYEYFTFQNIFTDRTFLQDIKILPAGHFATLSLRDSRSKLQARQYWDFAFQEPLEKNSDQDYREELDRLFTNAVKRQLVSDTELGCYLSGGVDSGSITSIAATQYPYLKTFTCGFDMSSASGLELIFDERAKAEAMSNFFKTEHYSVILKAGDMERVLPKLAYHLEEPRVGQSYPNYYAAKLASKFVKVVLSGAGGDELFGGYPWRYYRAVVNVNFDDYISKYYQFWQRLIPAEQVSNVFSPIWKDVSGIDTKEVFKGVFRSHSDSLSRAEDYINHSLYFEAKTFLHGLLVVEDKLSMAHGLENRVPFLDNDLVDFAMRCPVRLKLNNLSDVVRMNENDLGLKTQKYYEKNKDGKQILREVMQRHVPGDASWTQKQGFSGPDASWFKGESIEFVKRTLFDPNARIYSLLDRKEVKALVEEHLLGRENRRLLIWSLLNVETWLRQLES